MFYSDPLIKYAIHKYKGEGGVETQEELCIRLKCFDKKALIRFYILASGLMEYCRGTSVLDKPTIEELLGCFETIFERPAFSCDPPKKSEVINLIVENYVIKDTSEVYDCDGW